MTSSMIEVRGLGEGDVTCRGSGRGICDRYKGGVTETGCEGGAGTKKRGVTGGGTKVRCVCMLTDAALDWAPALLLAPPLLEVWGKGEAGGVKERRVEGKVEGGVGGGGEGGVRWRGNGISIYQMSP